MANRYGQATLEPMTPVYAGALGSWLLSITVGEHGIDDGGTLALARRDISDWEIPQFDRPRESGYVTAETNGQARLRLSYNQSCYVRPWRAAIAVDVYDGALAPGDMIWLRLGDLRQGGPGMRAQTFPESLFEFKLLVDAFGTGRYYPLLPAPHLSIVGGPAQELQLVVPSIARVGESFSVLIRALDSFGNPASHYEQTVQLRADDLRGLPPEVRFTATQGGVQRLMGVQASRPGLLRIDAQDGAGRPGTSNPIRLVEAQNPSRLYWGDLHGQTGETIGTGSIQEYLRFGRDVAGLDFIGWQGNDFQITNPAWEHIQDAIQHYHDPGHYVTFLGYEWSGLTPAGGDHNLHFMGDRAPLVRSSHWLLDDRSDEQTDRYPLRALLHDLHGRTDVMLVPHVGGRHANLGDFDAALMPVLELHSHHGTFEWLAQEALERGLRVGFIAGSDDHTCRPGLSYPTREASRGLASFDVQGGLSAVYAAELSRSGVWDALRRRHAYATSGARIQLAVTTPEGAMMGDELQGPEPPRLDLAIAGTAPILAVEIRRGLEVIWRWPAPDQVALLPLNKRRLAVVWSGVRVRTRSKKARWDGSLVIANGAFLNVEPFAFDRPEEGVIRHSTQLVSWRSTTSGDPDGILVDLEGNSATELRFASQPVSFSFNLGDVDGRVLSVKGGGVNLKTEVFWTPRSSSSRDLVFSYRDPQPLLDQTNAYWVRVLQGDGHMAWSSPLFYDHVG